MENFLTLVSSRGILRSCSIFSKYPKSSNPILNYEETILPAGGSIYVCTDALEDFIKRLLPNINIPFRLVTGDSDRSVNAELLLNSEIKLLIENPNLISWYAQNLLVKHKKIFHLPIGLDYHTAWERKTIFEIHKVSPFAQELSLLKILEESKNLQKRIPQAYCNWILTANRGDRIECLNKVEDKSIFKEIQRIERHISWKRQSEFCFTLSPEGEGADCHRTWESIMIGSIPIVKRGLMSALFENLPIVQVNDWGEVNEKFLLNILDDFSSKKFDFSCMFLGYWQKLINGLKPDYLPEMSMEEFKLFMSSYQEKK